MKSYFKFWAFCMLAAMGYGVYWYSTPDGDRAVEMYRMTARAREFKTRFDGENVSRTCPGQRSVDLQRCFIDFADREIPWNALDSASRLVRTASFVMLSVRARKDATPDESKQIHLTLGTELNRHALAELSTLNTLRQKLAVEQDPTKRSALLSEQDESSRFLRGFDQLIGNHWAQSPDGTPPPASQAQLLDEIHSGINPNQ